MTTWQRIGLFLLAVRAAAAMAWLGARASVFSFRIIMSRNLRVRDAVSCTCTVKLQGPEEGAVATAWNTTDGLSMEQA